MLLYFKTCPRHGMQAPRIQPSVFRNLSVAWPPLILVGNQHNISFSSIITSDFFNVSNEQTFIYAWNKHTFIVFISPCFSTEIFSSFCFCLLYTWSPYSNQSLPFFTSLNCSFQNCQSSNASASSSKCWNISSKSAFFIFSLPSP